MSSGTGDAGCMPAELRRATKVESAESNSEAAHSGTGSKTRKRLKRAAIQRAAIQLPMSMSAIEAPLKAPKAFPMFIDTLFLRFVRASMQKFRVVYTSEHLKSPRQRPLQKCNRQNRRKSMPKHPGCPTAPTFKRREIYISPIFCISDSSKRQIGGWI